MKKLKKLKGVEETGPQQGDLEGASEDKVGRDRVEKDGLEGPKGGNRGGGVEKSQRE